MTKGETMTFANKFAASAGAVGLSLFAALPAWAQEAAPAVAEAAAPTPDRKVLPVEMNWLASPPKARL